MRMGAAHDFVFLKPIRAQRSQQTEWIHTLFRVEYVINYAFEVESEKKVKKMKIYDCNKEIAMMKNSRVIGVGHDFRTVGRGELEWVTELVGLVATAHLLQARFVREILEVPVIRRHSARGQKLYYTCSTHHNKLLLSSHRAYEVSLTNDCIFKAFKARVGQVHEYLRKFLKDSRVTNLTQITWTRAFAQLCLEPWFH